MCALVTGVQTCALPMCTDRRNKALGSITFMGTHLVNEGYAAQLDSLGSDSGKTLWGVKSDRSAPSNRRSGAGHHGTTITRFSQVMASASDTDRQQVCKNSASSPARPSSLKRRRGGKAKTQCRPANQACQPIGRAHV